MGKKFYFRLMELFWNQIDVVFAQYYECTKPTELFTLTSFILCHMDFISINYMMMVFFPDSPSIDRQKKIQKDYVIFVTGRTDVSSSVFKTT